MDSPARRPPERGLDEFAREGRRRSPSVRSRTDDVDSGTSRSRSATVVAPLSSIRFRSITSSPRRPASPLGDSVALTTTVSLTGGPSGRVPPRKADRRQKSVRHRLGMSFRLHSNLPFDETPYRWGGDGRGDPIGALPRTPTGQRSAVRSPGFRIDRLRAPSRVDDRWRRS